MKTLPIYPANHPVGGSVPFGGSNCAKCSYLADNMVDCTQKDFIKWNGRPRIPGRIQEYCCDFFPVGEMNNPNPWPEPEPDPDKLLGEGIGKTK
jgi:hypothetical protein